MGAIVFVPKSIPNLRPVVAMCPICNSNTPHLIYERKGGPSAAPLLFAAFASMSGKKAVLICYNCFNIIDTKTPTEDYLQRLRENPLTRSVFNGSVQVFEEAKDVVDDVLQAAKFKEEASNTLFVTNQKQIDYHMDIALTKKRNIRAEFDHCMVSDMKPFMTKQCPRCCEEVKFEATVCRFCGFEFG